MLNTRIKKKNWHRSKMECLIRDSKTGYPEIQDQISEHRGPEYSSLSLPCCFVLSRCVKMIFPLISVIFVLFPSFSPSQIQDLIINEITSTPSHRFYELHSVPLKSLTGASADYAALIYLSKLGIFAEENHISKSNNSFLSLHIHVASATSRI